MMKQLLYIVSVLLLASCHQEENDILTMATVTLSAGDTLTVEQIQGTARITNLNSKQTTTTSDFDGAVLRVQLLRSSYSIDVEGLARCRNRHGEVSIRDMRAHSDYQSFVSKGNNEAVLDIIFLK